MNVVVEEIVSEFPVEVTEEIVVVEISDAVSFLELTDVADNTYTGKDGYVPTVNEATGKMELKEPTGGGGGGAVSSVFNRTGAVVAQNGDYTADQITETTGKVFVSPTEKANIAHANRSILDQITEAFTTALKNAYDGAVTWISTNGANVISAYEWVTTNGANVLNHIASTSNPHNVTKSQVGLGNVQNVDTTTTSNVTEGSRLYFTTDRVLATVLSGLSVASGGAIVDTDTVLVAFGKLQNQINAVPGLINSALASFKTANFLDATSSIQGQLDAKVNASRFIHNGETSITGTSTESNICSFKIPAGAYSANDGFKFDSTFTKGVTAGTITFRVYFGTSSGARTNIIGQNSVSNTGRASDFTRRYYINSGNINTSVGFTSNASSGLGTQTFANTPIAIDTNNDVWITITGQGQTISETIGVMGTSITPLK